MLNRAGPQWSIQIDNFGNPGLADFGLATPVTPSGRGWPRIGYRDRTLDGLADPWPRETARPGLRYAPDEALLMSWMGHSCASAGRACEFVGQAEAVWL